MNMLIHTTDSLVFAGPSQVGAGLASMLPARSLDVLAAVAILVCGWLVSELLARAIERIVRRALPESGALAHSPARLSSWVVRWLGLALAVLAGMDRLGVPLGRSVAERLAAVLPRILAAGMLFAVGTVAAMLSGALARRFFESAGVRHARWIGRLVTGVLIGFSVLMAIEQLGFAAQFVMGLGWIAAACAGLGFALAFGLGARDVARDVLVEYLRTLDEDPGSRSDPARGGPGESR